MTLKELYEIIGEDYDQAMRILRMEKLLDKHIRKFPNSGLVENLLAAGEREDGGEMFEVAHALKGVCGNLGLKALASAAEEITEEYRPGGTPKHSKEEIAEILKRIESLYKKAAEGIRQYEQA